jgi:hypothetical protein
MWSFGLWGLFGGFAVQALEFISAANRSSGWPWRYPYGPGAGPYVVALILRLMIGSGLAAASGASGQISGPFGAIAVGVAAPLILAQLASRVPVPDALTEAELPAHTVTQSKLGEGQT